MRKWPLAASRFGAVGARQYLAQRTAVLWEGRCTGRIHSSGAIQSGASAQALRLFDVGQATVLAREYEGKLRYSPSTDFLVYNGRFWEESKPKAQAVAQELTTRQLEEAETEIKKATDEMMKYGAWELLASMGPKKAAMAFSSDRLVPSRNMRCHDLPQLCH